jgi:hypothetical protein
VSVLPFGPWEPDSAGVDVPVMLTAKNVWPSKTGYVPIPQLSAASLDGLAERIVGITFARTASGGWLIFAGTRFKLYKFQSNVWNDVSRVAGGDYGVPEFDYWSFTQFGSKIIAVNLTDDPQVIDVDSGATNFTALGGSPPRARYVSVVGDFVVLASLSSGDRKLRNSAINDSAGWTVGTSLCDEQEFPDGASITGLAGGEFGWVMQEKGIRRMIFQPGSDLAFRFERVEAEHGAAAGYSLASTANSIFFLANDGFYSFGGNGLIPIGAQRVNEWFRANCDISRYYSVQAFTDPFAPRIGWAFYSSVGSTNFDRVIFYDWQIDRWSYAEIEAQIWSSLVTAGLTLEDLDFYGDVDSGGIPYPFDSRVWQGGAPVIGAVDADGNLAFLESATPLTAVLQTGPHRLNAGGRSKEFAIEPMGVLNDVTPTLRIGKRESTQASIAYTASASPSSLSGVWRMTASGRLHNFEVTLTQTSGTNWEQMQGIDIHAARFAGMK